MRITPIDSPQSTTQENAENKRRAPVKEHNPSQLMEARHTSRIETAYSNLTNFLDVVHSFGTTEIINTTRNSIQSLIEEPSSDFYTTIRVAGNIRGRISHLSAPLGSNMTPAWTASAYPLKSENNFILGELRGNETPPIPTTKRAKHRCDEIPLMNSQLDLVCATTTSSSRFFHDSDRDLDAGSEHGASSANQAVPYGTLLDQIWNRAQSFLKAKERSAQFGHVRGLPDRNRGEWIYVLGAYQHPNRR
jgi:hypothetical protein